MPQVKGLAFRSVLQAHAQLRGNDALDRVFGELDPELARTLRTPLASTWYPIASYAALWNAIQRTTGEDPDYPRLIGRMCAEHDLKLVHKVLFASLNTTVALAVTARMFGSYYDTGRCSSKRLDARTFHFTFTGCLGFNEPMWTELHGSLEVFVGLSSKEAARSQLLQGGHSGATSRVVAVTW